MLLYLFLLFLLWPFFYLYAEARRQYSLRHRGYWARRIGRDSVRYEEKRGRSIEHVIIEGEMMAVGPHVIYVPTDEEWKKSAPEWAHSRKNEIHIHSRAGSRHLMAVPEISQLAHDPRLLDIAHLYLGKEAFPFRATLFDKSPDANWLVVRHQDTALPLKHYCDARGWGPWSNKAGIAYAHAPATALSRVLALRVHWVFAADIDATYDELRSLGVRIVEPLEKKPWGLRQFTVEDLDGNRFYFHCD